jgi:hypothetical protein
LNENALHLLIGFVGDCVTLDVKKFLSKYESPPAAAAMPNIFQSIVKVPAFKEVYSVVNGVVKAATSKPLRKSPALRENFFDVTTGVGVSAIKLIFWFNF